MKKPIGIIIFLFFSFSIHASTVKVESVIGRAEYRKLSDSKWEKLIANIKLSIDHRIRTGKSSKVVLVCKDGSKITLRNRVVFDVEELKSTSEKKAFSFKLLYGKVKAAVTKLTRKKDKWTISTPTAVVGVRGTIFGISARGDKQCEVAVFKGKVEVKNAAGKIKQKSVIVKESEMVVIKKDKPPEDPVALGHKTFEEWATKIEKDDKYLEDEFIKW